MDNGFETGGAIAFDGLTVGVGDGTVLSAGVSGVVVGSVTCRLGPGSGAFSTASRSVAALTLSPKAMTILAITNPAPSQNQILNFCLDLVVDVALTFS